MMIELTSLWLPIVASAVIVFVASFILWMVLPYHKTDWKKVGNEDALMGTLRSGGVGPGMYMFPSCHGVDMKSPEFAAKMKAGPTGVLIVSQGWNFGRSLVLFFFWLLAVGVFVAYLASHALTPGAAYLKVFQITGTAAIMAHVLGPICDSIWKGVPWSVTIKHGIDGVIYSLLTAGTFGWLWPKVM